MSLRDIVLMVVIFVAVGQVTKWLDTKVEKYDERKTWKKLRRVEEQQTRALPEVPPKETPFAPDGLNIFGGRRHDPR